MTTPFRPFARAAGAPAGSLRRAARSPIARGLGLALVAGTLSACAGMTAAPPMRFDPSALPDAVRVPAGHAIALETVGKGEIAYECRAKKDVAGQFEWVFVGPKATLDDRMGRPVGRYYGPPATWVAADGSAITGSQVAVAPGPAGSLPLQLVKAAPATGAGAMQGVTYVQRVATRGGVAPMMPCDAATAGRSQIVAYQADYVFWKAAM